ncbi:SDR family oxidoreductase [Mucilaginibacter paludis]|uniref:Short-chain dehydrogenase/reductase SDR n=1 Tax=Mucilaginibacter paludis DSM 18603 TaxID=714943 RepID=H1YEV0_9SPHI|nr:SDR family oxidoreductase [Mucilaginibacter paludis]EHQ24367.1 short-chain dehydrogenase/reductase SDR [Mucilaginibacter paludis DSM 18603]
MAFKNQKVIIAGGTSGIGLATALMFADQSASTVVTGRDLLKLKAAEQLGLPAFQVDSTSPAQLDNFFSNIGIVNHLVIALGSNKGLGNFKELDLDNIRKGFEEKYWSHLNTIKAALPYMVSTNGSITLLTAITGTAKIPGTSGIGAVNGALEIMVPILAKELHPLRINAVSPGIVDTPWWDFLSAETKKETFADYAAHIPLGRVAQPEDIASAILFLAANTYVTGKVLVCDGGMA